jgi:hypothetical protein
VSAGTGTVQSFTLLEFAVHLGGTVKSVLTLLSVPNKPHFSCDLPVRRGSATQRQPKGLARQALGSKVVRKDERAYMDVLLPSSRKASNSASSFHQTDSNRKSGLRLRKTRKSYSWQVVYRTFRRPLSCWALFLVDVTSVARAGQGHAGRGGR